MYGIDSTVSTGESRLQFGVNFKVTLTKFEFNPNGGKDKSERDCVDITFNVNGAEVSNRQFPVESAYDDNNNEITDKNHPKFIEAVAQFNQKMTQLALCFVSEEELTSAFENAEINSFKSYINFLAEIIQDNNSPDHYLDLFAQYQWNIRKGSNRAYLEVPKNTKHGLYVVKHVEPVGKWKLDEKSTGIKYVDDDGNVHPITRNKWFADSNFAKSRAIDETPETDDDDFDF